MIQGNLLLKLTTESKARLLGEYKAIYEKVFADHVTLQYNVDLDKFKEIEGQRAEIRVEENCWNEDIQAVKVDIGGQLPIMNKIPHITISATNGTSPVKSNAMFLGGHKKALLESELKLEGVIYFEKYNGR